MYQKFGKRLLDVILSGCAIVVLSPVYLLIALAIKLDDPGPVFFRQKRVGIHKTHFTILKFRTMKCSTPKDVPTHLLENPEQYITRVGRFLRKTSLDEIPQLWNILKGDMSVIGPRPQLVRDMVFMTHEQRMRHSVRPGLSGLAQTRGRNALSWDGKLATDLEYIQKITFLGDVKIIFDTVKQVFFKEKGLEDSNVDEVDITDDFGDYLLKAGRVSQEEYDKKQAEAKQLLGV